MFGLKRSYNNDCKGNLRCGSVQLNKKYWHECHELGGGGGSAGTEPLNFGMETLSTETAQLEAETETRSSDKEETPEISVNIQDDSDDGDSRSVSPAPSVSSNTSCIVQKVERNRVENELKSQPSHLLITSVKNFRKNSHRKESRGS